MGTGLNTSKKPSNEDVVAAIKANLGLLGEAAIALNVTRMTLYNWIQKDEDLQLAINMQNEENIDFVESKLRKRIEGFTVETISTSSSARGTEVTTKDVYYPPAESSIQFYLKTKGKLRGYNSQLDVNVNDTREVNRDELDARILELKKRLEL